LKRAATGTTAKILGKMQYKHAFHAGNFADVHKHICLLQLIEALQKKAKGFLFLDTHAGEGLYDLGGAEARHGGESTHGIARLERVLSQSTGAAHAIRNYMDAITRLRRMDGNARTYPGSPLLAAMALRGVDLCTCVESQASTARALQRAIEHSAALMNTAPRIIHGDGYHEVRSQLPPAPRRGLILIDPPYESADEERQIAAALMAGLERFETGVFALWYPVKRQHDADLFLARLLRGVQRPALTAELCLHVADHGAGLNGSGMLIVNPPWQFDTDARQWQDELHTLLGAAGGATVKWLINE
jgi:23S rRNA (adenine2030-N6)-methyltransferase